MKSKFLSLLVVHAAIASAQPPQVSNGKIERLENFPSKFVTPRHVDVWLPAGYTPQKRYSVLYMHDGQMLFDSTTTWNKQSWHVSETVQKLINTGKIGNLIVAGIWNGGATRHPDYFPQRPFESLSTIERDTVIRQLQTAGRTKDTFQPTSDNYLKFLVHELKPAIDKRYSTLTDRAHTFVAGSSMGGLISMYAICEYPNVFGGAACLSTHWPGTFSVVNNPIPQAFFNYLKKKLPKPRRNKIYFDFGDQTLDAFYPPLQAKADEVMKLRGYAAPLWVTKSYPSTNHSEQVWASRLHVPLEFLLAK